MPRDAQGPGPDVSLADLMLRMIMATGRDPTQPGPVLGPRFTVVVDVGESTAPPTIPRFGVLWEARDAGRLARELAPVLQFLAAVVVQLRHQAHSGIVRFLFRLPDDNMNA